MRATAAVTDVDAETFTAGTQGGTPGSTTGRIDTHSHVALTGPASAGVTAGSSYQNVDIGGVLKIASVVATASAATNTVTASAHGTTTISGVTVAGIPASIDDQGLHIGSTTEPVNATAALVANQALAGAGMKVYVGQPTEEIAGAHVTYTTGSLVILWQPPSDSNRDTFTVTLGGASVTAGASPGFGTLTAPVVPSEPNPGPSPGGSSADVPPGGPAALGEAPPTLASSQGPALPRPSDVGGPTALAGRSVATGLPHGLSPGWPILALLGAGLIAYSFRRLPDRLVDPVTTTCPLEGDR
jgi:hypothetical protein